MFLFEDRTWLRRAMSGVAGVALLTPFLAQRADAATAYALTAEDRLLQFDTASPGSISRTVSVGGLDAGEDLLGIDFRPAEPSTAQASNLYGLSSFGQLYKINAGTGQAAKVGAALDPAAAPLLGEQYGFDFNPAVDRIRVVSDLGENLRLNPNDGMLAAADTALAYATGDDNAGSPPDVRAVAYTNSDNDPATATELYGIDSELGVLVEQDPPNMGVLNTVGSLGLSDNPLVAGFDIFGASNDAFFATSAEPAFGALAALDAELYGIDLDSGAASLIGTIGDGSAVITGLAVSDVAAVPVPAAVFIFPIGAAMAAFYQFRLRRRMATI